jgi:hypothetical protein
MSEALKRLSNKELSKKFRHAAYLRAKEYRKTDPRQIAMKNRQKEQRREAYQRTKESNKAFSDEIKKDEKDNVATIKNDIRENLKKNVFKGSSIKQLPPKTTKHPPITRRLP